MEGSCSRRGRSRGNGLLSQSRRSTRAAWARTGSRRGSPGRGPPDRGEFQNPIEVEHAFHPPMETGGLGAAVVATPTAGHGGASTSCGRRRDLRRRTGWTIRPDRSPGRGNSLGDAGCRGRAPNRLIIANRINRGAPGPAGDESPAEGSSNPAAPSKSSRLRAATSPPPPARRSSGLKLPLWKAGRGRPSLARPTPRTEHRAGSGRSSSAKSSGPQGGLPPADHLLGSQAGVHGPASSTGP